MKDLSEREILVINPEVNVHKTTRLWKLFGRHDVCGKHKTREQKGAPLIRDAAVTQLDCGYCYASSSHE